MQKQAKTPQRMCVACRQMRDKPLLLRIVRTKDGSLAIDHSGKAAGRGAYICLEQACWQRAQKARCIERALKTRPSDELVEQISQLVAAQTASKPEEQI